MMATPMSLAWHWYRSVARIRALKTFDRVEFARALSRGHREYRADLDRAAWAAEQAAMTQTERRVAAIEAEIERLEYAPFGIDAGAKERALRAELAALQTTANQRIAA